MTTETLQELKAMGSATIHEAQGQSGAMASAIKPIDPGFRLAGPAYTIDCRPDDNLAIHFALTKAKPGDVLVVDAKAFVEAGPWGDVMSFAAQKAGIAGLVIDGAVRDSATVVEMGFPIFCRGLSIKGTAKNQPGRVQVPIVCGGVAVRPGDIVVGDRDGVVVIKRERTEEVLDLSRKREAKEDSMRKAIDEGATIADLIGLGAVFERLGMAEGR